MFGGTTIDSRVHGYTRDGLPYTLLICQGDDSGAIEEPPVEEGDAIDIQQIDRSGQVAVLGVPNSGKSSLVNELVGTKVSIVSPKPQTTRQRILGLALLAPRPGMSPTTQAVFADTAGIMETGQTVAEFGFRHKRKRLFRQNRMHKAMVKTAWKQTKASDAVLWVLDAAKCYMYLGCPVFPSRSNSSAPTQGAELMGSVRTL